MSKVRLFWATGTLLAIAGCLAGGCPLKPHVPRQPMPVDELLAEVRGLRAEIAQAAGASLRMQLLIARLQLQEQRTYTVARQVAEVQELLAKIRQEISQQSAHLERMEEAESRVTDENDRRDIREMIQRLKVELEPKQRREQELRTQEGDLLNLLTAEQARWAEFNDRLDSLERSLPAGSPR